MLKDKNYLSPNAIVDFNLKIVDSNSFFNEIFQHKKDWKKLPLKITDLIEFDNLSEFKKSLYTQPPASQQKNSFRGKVKIGNKGDSVNIIINHLREENKGWSNQVVELTCQKVKQNGQPLDFPKMVIENSPFQVFTIDQDYNISYFNQSGISLLNSLLCEKPVLGQNFFTNQKLKEEWKKSFDRILSNEDYFLEKKFSSEELNHQQVLTISSLKNEKGVIVGCIIYSNDEFKFKKQELLNYQIHKKYQHIFENDFLAICVINKRGELALTNDSFCRMMEIENLAAKGIKVANFFYDDDFKFLSSQFRKIFRKEISHFATELKTKTLKNQFKYIRMNMSGLLKNGEISGCLVSLLDISSQRKYHDKELEIKDLGSNEEVNMEYQNLLEKEIESKNRELTINQMLISQKNNLIKEVSKKLEILASKSNLEIRPEIRKIISSLNRQDVINDDWKNLKIHFVKMHPSFFDKLISKSSKITQKDLRHCAYIKLGFSAKETSDLLGTLPRSIEQARFRIKKKLNLPAEQKLKDYLRSI